MFVSYAKIAGSNPAHINNKLKEVNIMLKEQITALELKQEEAVTKIDNLEAELKKAKNDLTLIKRARQSLERLEEQLNGQIDIPE